MLTLLELIDLTVQLHVSRGEVLVDYKTGELIQWHHADGAVIFRGLFAASAELFQNNFHLLTVLTRLLGTAGFPNALYWTSISSA